MRFLPILGAPSRPSQTTTMSARAVSTAAVLAASLLAGCAPGVEPLDPALLQQPDDPAFLEPAPDTFVAAFETTEGTFRIEVVRAWAPRGADRFFNLVRAGFYDGTRFFRVVEGFVVQFGMSADTAITRAWQDQAIADDPVRASNVRGTITFATSGPDSRTTQLFINLVDNARLDPLGFAPFGRVSSGMDVVDSLYAGYGDGPPRGNGPSQGRIAEEGGAYLAAEFPELDQVRQARVSRIGPDRAGLFSWFR